MVLLSKKIPCSICGGKISWLLPSKVGGQYVCDTCYNKIDMDNDMKSHLTMQSFREYLEFYDQNQLLRDQFVISELIDLGLWNKKIIFDYQNKLFCMSKYPIKTVFEGKQLKYFIIKEDSTPIFEGSAECIKHYTSTVPELAKAMAPKISQFKNNKAVACTLDNLEDGKEKETTQNIHFDVPGPFRAFNVELYLDHPYWSVITCEMDGPRFDDNILDVKDYIRSYQYGIEEMERLVAAIKLVAFPDAVEKHLGRDTSKEEKVHTTLPPLTMW